MVHLTIALVFCVTILLSFSESAQKQTPVSNYASLTGLPGIPGMHGKPGAPGRDGRDGREGKRGPRGFQGSPGQKGPPGSPGSVGKPGARGRVGAKGEKGDRGPSGVSFHSNWKECSWKNLNDGKDNGLIKQCVFYKKHSNTFLQVSWNGALRVYGGAGSCKRWFFTLNGAECKSPNPIDGLELTYSGIPKNHNIHKVLTIQGHCGKIHKGHVRVGFNVGNCKGYGKADAYTGWNSVSRIFVEEVPRPQL